MYSGKYYYYTYIISNQIIIMLHREGVEMRENGRSSENHAPPDVRLLSRLFYTENLQ